jgi:hypothetical protein
MDIKDNFCLTMMYKIGTSILKNDIQVLDEWARDLLGN